MAALRIAECVERQPLHPHRPQKFDPDGVFPPGMETRLATDRGRNAAVQDRWQQIRNSLRLEIHDPPAAARCSERSGLHRIRPGQCRQFDFVLLPWSATPESGARVVDQLFREKTCARSVATVPEWASAAVLLLRVERSEDRCPAILQRIPDPARRDESAHAGPLPKRPEILCEVSKWTDARSRDARELNGE